jgi:DNA-binding transcriptional LysR family regulator
MYLGPLLFPLLSRHPRLEVALSFDDRAVDMLVEGYDLGIRIGRLQDSSLVARKLASSPRIVCCSPDYARRAGLPTALEDIPKHTCIDYANVHSSQIWQFEPAEQGGKVRSLVVRGRIVLNNGEAMREAAIAGLGLVVLPTFIVHRALASGQLIDALPSARPVADAIYALYPYARHVSGKVRAVIDHLVEQFAGGPPWEREFEPADRPIPGETLKY